jgi:hypothetical protein
MSTRGASLCEPLERLDDLVEALPVARGSPNSAVDDQALRVLGNLVIEIVHQHAHGGLGGPAFGHDLPSATRADVTAVVASANIVCGGQLSTPPYIRLSGPGRPTQ